MNQDRWGWISPAVMVALSWSFESSAAVSDSIRWFDCRDGLGRPCTAAQLADPLRYRQVLVYPGGFQSHERSVFETAFEKLLVSQVSGGDLHYSALHADQLLYLAFWVPGGAIGTVESSFGAAVVDHPLRGRALTLKQDKVIEFTDDLIRQQKLDPWATAVLFNTTEPVTSNAAPPSMIRKNYGIARFTLSTLDGDYVPTHELAHAGLNFLDEYIESGFENTRAQSFDVLTSSLLFNRTSEGRSKGWSQLLQKSDIRVSEILVANGADNMDVSRYPSRVETEGYSPNEYEFEGGMFFGKGTWHDAGENLMNSVRAPQPGNGFAFDHSESQKQVIHQVFVDPLNAPRPNDRIRAAGPPRGWIGAGKTLDLVLFDGDKNHRFHPTLAYEVQVGWWTKVSDESSEAGTSSREKKWLSFEKRIPAKLETVELQTSRAMGLGKAVQRLVCAMGLGEISYGGEKLDACASPLEEVVDTLVPTVSFALPYQWVEVPAPQAFETYYWRFRTDNGTWKSGWTSWSKVRRGF